MHSTNFEFLRPHCPELADLGGFAELYAESDPSSSLIKLRQFGENLVADFFMYHRLPRLPRASFIELLQALEEQALVPGVILDKLHALRIQGNQAVHGSADALKAHHAMWILQEAFDLARWVALTLHGDADAASREFMPPARPDSKGAIKREKKAVLQKPYAGVSTAILLFTKGGETRNVWFYKVKHDGYSLDDKRTPVKDDDLPDLVKQWHARNPKNKGKRTDKCFWVPKKEIVGNKYDLSFSRYAEIEYEPVEYDPPKVILKRLRKIEAEISNDLDELEAMLG